jgi:hypothetical protein
MCSAEETMRIRCLQVGVLCLLLLLPFPASALAPQDIRFPDLAPAGELLLPLHNAAPVRYLRLFTVSMAGLYLPADVPPERALSDIPKRLEIGYLVPIPGRELAWAAQTVLARSQTPEALARLQGLIDRLHLAYRDVKPGDRYALTYLPGRGTELALNGEPLATVEGAEFAAAYFGIWLGHRPIDEGLKRALLRSR